MAGGGLSTVVSTSAASRTSPARCVLHRAAEEEARNGAIGVPVGEAEGLVQGMRRASGHLWQPRFAAEFPQADTRS